MNASLDEMRHRFAELLGEGDASDAAFRAAVDDPVYARQLMGSRGAPDVVRMLLDAPPPVAPEPSTGALAVRASRALARWAGAGFEIATDATLTRRLAACAACEHLEDPTRAIQRVAVRGAAGPGVCGLCGCAVGRKAKLATESCPAPHPTQPGLSRWSEPSASPTA